eukprot:3702491-Amphidinium_carterae.1
MDGWVDDGCMDEWIALAYIKSYNKLMSIMTEIRIISNDIGHRGVSSTGAQVKQRLRGFEQNEANFRRPRFCDWLHLMSTTMLERIKYARVSVVPAARQCRQRYNL